MKIKDGFMLREIAGQWLVVPTGTRTAELNAIITLSESGALLWQCLAEEKNESELIEALREVYEVDYKTAECDTKAFIAQLNEANLL